MEKIELNSLTLNDLKNYMVEIGEKKFRGEQIFSFFNRNKKLDIIELKVLPKNLREKLNDATNINKLKINERFDST